MKQLKLFEEEKPPARWFRVIRSDGTINPDYSNSLWKWEEGKGAWMYKSREGSSRHNLTSFHRMFRNEELTPDEAQNWLNRK